MKYSVSPPADRDIREIYVRGALQFGLAQAERYSRDLFRTFEFLADYPRAARLRAEIHPPVRAYRFKAHLIVYEIDASDCVVILRIRHGREDWLSNPRGEDD